MPDLAPLEAVLLDAGGTLVRLDFEWMSEMLAEMGESASAEALRRGEVEGRRRFDRSATRADGAGAAGDDGRGAPPLGRFGDIREYYGGTLEAAGVSKAKIGAAIERLQKRQSDKGLWTRPMEGARLALDDLVAQGLRCAVVSNSDGRAEKHLRDCGMLRGLEFVVDSHVVGVEKPDPGIFRIALDRLGVAPGRALFVGDVRSVDEAGARAAGIRFVLLDPHGDYADGSEAIASMDRLPEFVRARFAPARRRAGSREPERPQHQGGDRWRHPRTPRFPPGSPRSRSLGSRPGGAARCACCMRRGSGIS